MIHIVLIFMVTTLLLIGCNTQSTPAESITTTSENESFTMNPSDTEIDIQEILDIYFDESKEHKPLISDVQSITMSMPISEVIERIGKPHGFGPTSGLFSLSWETTTGEMFYIVFLLDSNAPTEPSSLEQYMKHGVAGNCIPYSSGETTNQ